MKIIKRFNTKTRLFYFAGTVRELRTLLSSYKLRQGQLATNK